MLVLIEMRTDYVIPLTVTAQYTTYNLSSSSRSLESMSLRQSWRFVFMNVYIRIFSWSSGANRRKLWGRGFIHWFSRIPYSCVKSKIEKELGFISSLCIFSFFQTISKSKSKEGLLEAFRVFDKTDDGFIAVRYWKSILRKNLKQL